MANTKQERREQVLHMPKGILLDVGDKVWLTILAQKLHVSHTHGEPVDEGPLDIVEKVLYETVKVLVEMECVLHFLRVI